MADLHGRRTLGDRRPLPALPGWDGPPDPVEDLHLVFCRCGVEKPRSERYCWSCGSAL
jgi:hypothetical protein